MENDKKSPENIDLKNKVLGEIKEKKIEMDSTRVCLVKECLKENAWIIVVVLLAIVVLYFLGKS